MCPRCETPVAVIYANVKDHPVQSTPDWTNYDATLIASCECGSWSLYGALVVNHHE